MAQILTVVSVLAAACVVTWTVLHLRRRAFGPTLEVDVRLDHSSPGAHLLWTIRNRSTATVTLGSLVIHDRTGATRAVPPGFPEPIEPGAQVVVPTDVDWTLLGARSIGVTDADGGEHAAAQQQLTAVQERLRDLMDRRVYTASARDWLFGATNLAFGVVLLGLGFFMLMWVIATG